jgi:cyanophycin synthetase
VLETRGVSLDSTLLEAWRVRVERARAQLGWSLPGAVARTHAAGASLAIAAPCDQLFLATEVNEWAWCASVQEREPARWPELEAGLLEEVLADAADPQSVLPPVLEETAALRRFRHLAEREGKPALRQLLDAADARALPHLLDDEQLTLGAGCGGRSYALAALPAVAAVPWGELHGIPTALVTGSNGKTTTVRLLAACAREHGWHAAYNCTDGVFLDREPLASGDYSGPAGTRLVIRQPRAEAAILETARGGILRRGIAVSQARAAVVTNVSSDHFGEFGIDDLGGLADAKLSVAGVVGREGLLVLNADDPVLCDKAASLEQRLGYRPRIGWFALDAEAPLLRAAASRGLPTCGVRDGRLRLEHAGREHDLGSVASMPLAIGGMARYNVANLAAAALAAAALDMPPAVIASVFAKFGAAMGDNPGRMMRFALGDVHVLLDYAHNPDGLRAFLAVASGLRTGGGRLAVLLGHAGNRRDADIREVAQVVAGFFPELVVIKEIPTHLRGRAPGEIPALLRAALLEAGLKESALAMREGEIEAARCALEWARPGDVLGLLVHGSAARAQLLAMLEERQRGGAAEPPESRV